MICGSENLDTAYSAPQDVGGGGGGGGGRTKGPEARLSAPVARLSAPVSFFGAWENVRK